MNWPEQEWPWFWWWFGETLIVFSQGTLADHSEHSTVCSCGGAHSLLESNVGFGARFALLDGWEEQSYLVCLPGFFWTYFVHYYKKMQLIALLYIHPANKCLNSEVCSSLLEQVSKGI